MIRTYYLFFRSTRAPQILPLSHKLVSNWGTYRISPTEAGGAHDAIVRFAEETKVVEMTIGAKKQKQNPSHIY